MQIICENEIIKANSPVSHHRPCKLIYRKVRGITIIINNYPRTIHHTYCVLFPFVVFTRLEYKYRLELHVFERRIFLSDRRGFSYVFQTFWLFLTVPDEIDYFHNCKREKKTSGSTLKPDTLQGLVLSNFAMSKTVFRYTSTSVVIKSVGRFGN